MRIPKNFVALTGDRERIFQSNLHLAKIASLKATKGRDLKSTEFLDDMHSAAMLGLMIAASQCDLERLNEFSGFAWIYMKKAMLKRRYENENGATFKAQYDRRKGVIGSEEEAIESSGSAEDIFVDRRRSEFDVVDLKDEVSVVLSMFNQRDQDLMRRHWIDGIKVPVLVMEFGLTKFCIANALMRAKRKARMAREAI